MSANTSSLWEALQWETPAGQRDVRFLRVQSARDTNPLVFATVDGIRVTWRSLEWRCACEQRSCIHIQAVVNLLDPNVFIADKKKKASN